MAVNEDTIKINPLYGEKGKETAARFLIQDTAGQNTPEQRTIAKLRSIVEKNPPSPLEGLAIKPISDEKILAALDKAISAERDPATQKKVRPPNSEHERKFKEAENSVQIYQEFLKKGYHQMPEWERNIYRTIAFKAIRRIYPDVVRAWEGMSDREKEMQMDRMLSDPEFARHVAAILESIVDGAQEPKQMPQELLDRVNQTKLEYDLKRKELEWMQRDYDKIKNYFDQEYETKGAGTRGQELEGMQPMNVLEQKHTIAVNRLERENERLNQLYQQQATARSIRDPQVQAAELTRLAGEIANQQITVEKAQKAVEKTAEDLNKRKTLEEEKKRLEDDLRRLERELVQKQIEFDHAEKAYFTALADKNDFEEDIRRSEEEFLRNLNSVMEKATEEWIRGELQRYEEARDQLLREAGEQYLERGLQRRWNINRGRKAPEFNKRTIDEDYSDLIRKGPDEVILRTLVEGGMSREDAEIKLANDKQFRERATRAVVDRLLTRRLQTGKITEAEAMRIIDSPWGADAIQNAFEQKAKYTGELNRLREAGLLDGGFIDKLKALPHNKWLLILAALFGLGVYGIGVGSLIDLVGEGAHQVRQNYGQIGKLL